MIEVDSVRRNFNVGHYDPGFMLPNHPLAGAFGAPPMDHRVLVHWNQQGSNPHHPAAPDSTSPTNTGARSDEEDDDEDEDRPFTPPPPRERLSYTRYQLELLNGIFEEVRYPNSTQKQLIAKRVGITREQVKIWFQNRRRKDVIGNNGKPKSCDTSTCSTSSSGSSSKDSDQQNSPTPAPEFGDSCSPSEDNASSKESEEPVVPPLVMKSVIGELIKFTNDPLKGKKNRKKAKAKQKEKNFMKKSLASTLLAGSYDMISPPNQITPTAFFEKVKSKFNHSKNKSAFACPRDNTKVPGLAPNIPSSTDIPPIDISSKTVSDIPNTSTNNPPPRHYPVAGTTGIPSVHSSFPNRGYPPYSNDLPILSDMLTFKSGIETSRHKDLLPPAPSTGITSPTSSTKASLHREGADTNLPTPPSALNALSSVRHLNGIYPYPFLAEQPFMLSSLRPHDNIFRPAPHYPVSHSHFTDDPYQPLFISSLSNPYYTPPPGAWQAHAHTAQAPPSAYTQL